MSHRGQTPGKSAIILEFISILPHFSWTKAASLTRVLYKIHCTHFCARHILSDIPKHGINLFLQPHHVGCSESFCDWFIHPHLSSTLSLLADQLSAHSRNSFPSQYMILYFCTITFDPICITAFLKAIQFFLLYFSFHSLPLATPHPCCGIICVSGSRFLFSWDSLILGTSRKKLATRSNTWRILDGCPSPLFHFFSYLWTSYQLADADILQGYAQLACCTDYCWKELTRAKDLVISQPPWGKNKQTNK